MRSGFHNYVRQIHENSVSDFLLNTVLLLVVSFFSFAGLASVVDPGIDCSHKIFEDSSGKLTFPELVNLAGKLPQINTDRKNLGYSTSNFWMLVSCSNETKTDWSGVLEVDYSLLDTVEVFLQSDSIQPTFVAGDRVGFAERPILYRHPSVPLLVGANASATFHLKFASAGSVQIPIRIRNNRSFVEFVSGEYLMLGIYNGIVAVIGMFVLALAINLKERFYLYLLGYIASFHLLQITINGLGFQYFWPANIWINNHAPAAIAAWTSGFAILFSREYLKTRVYFPRIDPVIKVSIYICLLLPLFGFVVGQKLVNSLISPLGLVVTLLLTLLGVASIPKGLSSAGYFVAGWSCMLVGIFVSALKGLGLIPYSFLTSYAMQVGGIFEMILLAIGFSWRLKEAEASRLEMEKKAFFHAKENQKLEIIAKTAQSLAHDIKKPFSMIKLVTNLLDRAASPADIASILVKLGPQLSRAQISVDLMLTDLLEVSANPNLHREAIEIGDTISESVEYLQNMFPNKKITLDCNLLHASTVFGDPVKILRVFTNILQNAFQAAPAGGRIWLESRDHVAAGITAIEIVIGNEKSFVPVEVREKIFELDYSSGKSGGTGLGLAIAKKIIVEHGGKITCESNLEWGTEFHILLPVSVNNTGDRDTDVGA